MSDLPSEDHEKAASILRRVESHEHANIKSVETNGTTGRLSRLTVEVALLPGDNDE